MEIIAIPADWLYRMNVQWHRGSLIFTLALCRSIRKCNRDEN